MPVVLALIVGGIGWVVGMFVGLREGGDFNFAPIFYAPIGGFIGAIIGAAVGTWCF